MSAKASGRIIFHCPMALEGRAAAGSNVRPKAMKAAFEALGLEVRAVLGEHGARVERFDAVREEARAGARFDFVYSETSTMPTLLTEPDHRPRLPAVDYALFFWARRNRIPVYLFYRDAHWRFEHYRRAVAPLKRWAATAFYHLDLRVYRRTVDELLLPTLEMAAALPVAFESVRALPPGHGASFRERRRGTEGPLRLLYVGGTGPLYRYGALLDAVSRRPEVELVLCTREVEFRRYGPKRPLPGNVRLVHAEGRELQELYGESDVACIVVEPSEYWKLTRPVKLYEALGHGIPVLVSEGLGLSKWVEERGIGWSVPYEPGAIASRLALLSGRPDVVGEAAANAREEAPHHTWSARAKLVCELRASRR